MVANTENASITSLNRKFNKMARKREVESANAKWFGSAAHGTDKDELSFTLEKYEEEILLLDSIEACFRRFVQTGKKKSRVPKAPQPSPAQ